jgi:cellulose synthase/poly-beta-1,6-N-acetylglucosamine synthase-like glycosyltransferase/peptidoglycan/xylan/chitin deacetylase (PgdA/CDA1 family)
MTSDQHVFFDPTGRRWRRLRLLMIMTTVITALAALISWRQIHEVPSAHASPASPVMLDPTDVPTPPPVIGTGPLVRAARIEHRPSGIVAVDPLSGRALREVHGPEAADLGTARYALDRYGYSTAAHKTISLTFDDGPDPTWTPRILDLLARHRVQSTFFVTGSAAVRHPEIMVRLRHEGHAVGNHTFTHPHLTPERAKQELVLTDRIIRATTGVGTSLFRLPYDGDIGKVTKSGINTVLAVQQLGYTISLSDFDTRDWLYGDAETRPPTAIPFPPTGQDNLTILLHDGGGNRAATLAYVERLIPWARAHGYTFHSLPQVSQQVRDGTRTVTPAVWDRATYWGYRIQWYGAGSVLRLLFLLAIASVVVGTGVNVALALIRRLWNKRRWAGLPDDFTGPEVSVVIAAYNEEAVIAKTLVSLRRSRYQNIAEFIVVDDGSTDRTADIVAELAAEDPRIYLVRQANAGKASALNRAFRNARGKVVVTLDADTVFTPSTVGNLVRHFTVNLYDRRRLGAVCGVIRVGNLRNLLTRWQALEVVTQLGVERGAQDQMQGIMVVPGACAAWRRDAVLYAGGYSHATLTEDCDMALSLQNLGYRVTQDDNAICYTEVPENVRALTRQRFRWMYGNLQALWKHRGMLLNPRFGWLGLVTLPQAVVSVVLPVVFLPFVYAMAVFTVRGAGLGMLLRYGALFLVVQLASAVVGIWLTGERMVHLLMVPLYRLIYEPLRTYLLYRSAYMIMRGTRLGWNKLQRTGNVVVPAAEQRVEVGS